MRSPTVPMDAAVSEDYPGGTERSNLKTPALVEMEDA